MKAQQYLDRLLAEGRISFTKEQMQHELGITTNAVGCLLRRLKQKGQVVSLAKGYYLIISPEFRNFGCLPPDFFIDDLMKYLQMDYYVALLSAAHYYGAAHQQPQVFQVMLPINHPDIECGRVRIKFIKNKNISQYFTMQLKTRTGYMRVSTPEATARDLLDYIPQSGGVGLITTIIDELAEKITADKLQNLARQSKQQQWVQRLGYVLETLGHEILAESLHEVIKNKKLRIIPLVPNRTMTRAARDKKWRVAINTTIKSEVSDDTP